MGGYKWTFLGNAAVVVGSEERVDGLDAGAATGLFLLLPFRPESCVGTIVVAVS